jgi:hypothetical protein
VGLEESLHLRLHVFVLGVEPDRVVRSIELEQDPTKVKKNVTSVPAMLSEMQER